MTKVVVVHHSVSDEGKALADAVARAAQAEAYAVDAPDLLAKLADADAIVFGCASTMGSASAGFKTFMESTDAIRERQGWRDKLAAGFTHSARPGGESGPLAELAAFAAQHGMLWIGHSGAERLGERVAAAAKRWGRVEATPDEPGDAIVSAEPERHPAAQYWAFPSFDRADLPPGVERTNLRELVARPARFEHHLVVCAAIGKAQLEITAASEPVPFAHIHCSDEIVVALPTGDDIADRFPLRTFLARPDGTDAGRYNHRNGDAVLHPQGWLHWPGRLRAPYATFDFPPGMRRTGLSIVYCASTLTRGRSTVREAPAGRTDDVKVYTEPAPPMAISDLKTAGRVGAIGKTYLDLVVEPAAIELPNGGFVVVLETTREAKAFPCDLYRLEPGAKLEGHGITRALVFASETDAPDPAPPSWSAAPEPPFVPYEEAPPGPLPLDAGKMHVSEAEDGRVKVVVGGVDEGKVTTAAVPRYWLARMLYRIALHGYRLGYVETYEGFFVDDRGDGPVRVGLRAGPNESAVVSLPREEMPALVEKLYRAVAPRGYVERLR